MSSGFKFRDVDCYCSNGMAEYLLDLCISEFKKVPDHAKHSQVLNFFVDYREMFFSGLVVILGENDFSSKDDFAFIARLLEKVFEYALGSRSELSEAGKEKIELYFMGLIPELDSYASNIT